MRASRWLSWLEREDEEACRWALGYLFARGFRVPEGAYDRAAADQLESMLHQWVDPSLQADYHRIDEKMKRAWNAKLRRQKRKKEGYEHFAFEMPEDIKSLLRSLSTQRKQTQAALVEGLIRRADKLEQDCQEELERRSAALARNRGSKSFSVKMRGLEREVAQLNYHVSLLQDRVKSLTRQLCEARARMKAAGIAGTPALTVEQEKAMHAEYLALVESYFETCAAALSEKRAQPLPRPLPGQ